VCTDTLGIDNTEILIGPLNENTIAALVRFILEIQKNFKGTDTMDIDSIEF
jgi:hypothetical protein